MTSPVLFLASTKTIPPINPLPGVTQGFLLLDLTTSISFAYLVPASGRIDWSFNLKPNTGVFLQNVSFTPVPLSGTFSNLLR